MDQGWELADEQWSEIDGHILNSQQTNAYRLIREWVGTGPEESKHIVRQRFYFLQAKRPGDFAWHDFPCEDYLASIWADHGCWDSPFTMVIRPTMDLEIREDIGLLVVGGPGFDGILWGYRRGRPGLWEYVPIDAEFTLRAGSAEELVASIFS